MVLSFIISGGNSTDVVFGCISQISMYLETWIFIDFFVCIQCEISKVYGGT